MGVVEEEISQKVRKTDRGEDERDIILRTERPAHVPPEAGRGHPDSPASAVAATWGLGVSPGQQNNSACRRTLGQGQGHVQGPEGLSQ